MTGGHKLGRLSLGFRLGHPPILTNLVLPSECSRTSFFISQSGEVLLQETQFALKKYILPSKMVRTCHQKVTVRYLVPPVPPLENQFTHLPSLYMMVCLTILKHVILIHSKRFWTCRENEPYHLASTLMLMACWFISLNVHTAKHEFLFFHFWKDNGTPNLTSNFGTPQSSSLAENKFSVPLNNVLLGQLDVM